MSTAPQTPNLDAINADIGNTEFTVEYRGNSATIQTRFFYAEAGLSTIWNDEDGTRTDGPAVLRSVSAYAEVQYNGTRTGYGSRVSIVFRDGEPTLYLSDERLPDGIKSKLANAIAAQLPYVDAGDLAVEALLVEAHGKVRSAEHAVERAVEDVKRAEADLAALTAKLVTL